jgi:hypothetical protein
LFFWQYKFNNSKNKKWGLMPKEKNEVIIAARIPRTLRRLMEQFITRDTHMGLSDLIRDAVREKIQREAPELYSKLFRVR